MVSILNRFPKLEPKVDPINSKDLASLEEVKSFLNVYDNEDDDMIQAFMESALEYIKSYTGLDDEEIKAKAKSLRITLMLMVVDLYDNRGQQNLQFKRNVMLTSILDMHSKNYL